MSEKQFLRAGMPATAADTGLFGRRLVSFYGQLEGVLASEIGADAALLLAEPVNDRGSVEVDWYTTAEGAVRLFADLPAEDQDRTRAALAVLYRKLTGLRDRLLASPDADRQQLGKILREAIVPPRAGETYAIGDHIVTLSWACGPHRVDAGAPIVLPQELTPGSAPPLGGDSSAPEQDVRIETRTLPPPTVHVVAGPRFFRIAFAAAVGLLALSALGYGVLAALAARDGADSRYQLDLAGRENAGLRRDLATLQASIADKRLKCGQFKFPTRLTLLQGEWVNTTPIGLKGMPPDYALTVFMIFDATGKGELRMIPPDHKQICHASLTAHFVPNVELTFTTPELRCDPSGSLTEIQAQQVHCVPSPDGLAICTMKNNGEDQSEYRATFIQNNR